MLLSLCTPVMNRTADLKKTMPLRIAAAELAPPVEFVFLNYGSQDDLDEFLLDLHLPPGITYTYRYFASPYYRQAHAYNLAILASHAETFCLMGADTYPIGDYFGAVREQRARGAIWVEDPRYKGAIACQKQAFLAVGGYDERFEFYGPEDRDLAERLTRAGYAKAILDRNMIGNFHTPDAVKMANYRLPLSKAEASAKMRKIYLENHAAGRIQVNPQGWGAWN